VRRELVWSSQALKDLSAIARTSRRQADRIEAAMQRYADQEVGDVVKLTGLPRHRLRVGDWRVLFTLTDAGLVVLALRVLRRNEGTYR
jgi:mRNA-degrading endonuclease RelE of RelBE toxin-antitoxin system